MCIVHSTLRDATTPYTKRYQTLKTKLLKHEKTTTTDLSFDPAWWGGNGTDHNL